MSWLKNSSLRASFNKRRISNSPPKDADPSACYDSFRKHWQQANEIIQRIQQPPDCPTQDDILGVVNHLDHMSTLLLLELRAAGTGASPGNLPLGPLADNPSSPTPEPRCSPCPSLEYLLSENLLDKLYSWSLLTGRYSNVLILEQLKLYELLVSLSRHQVLVHEPFLRPLLKLLASSVGEKYPLEVEKRLVLLLNQLCISLMQNIQLLDLFFFASQDQRRSNFLIFSLLIPFVHREEGIGQQARDALLLCMSLSKKNESVGQYIAHHSNVCPVLATGLSGLYSALERKLLIESEDWHCLTPDDVMDLPALSAFMNSLEFCNAVVQVAHPLVKSQLLEFLYQGFLVPVMAPALLQDSVGLSDDQLDTALDASTVDELVGATAYLELFIRSVTEPGLLCSFVRFLLEDKYDGERILDHLVQRLSSKTRLGLVTLSLLDTLVALHCEDVMLELVFRHLVPCSHIMVSQRRRVRDTDPYCRSAERFLSLAPSCCSGITVPSGPPSLPPLHSGTRPRVSSSCDTISSLSSLPATTSLYGLKHSESLYGNYHAYLCDARAKLQACAEACEGWVYPYDGETPPYEAFSTASPERKVECKPKRADNEVDVLSNLETVNLVEYTDVHGLLDEESHKEGEAEASSREDKVQLLTGNDLSLQSVGESSGYESFAFKCSADSTPENEPSDETAPALSDEGIMSPSSSEADISRNKVLPSNETGIPHSPLKPSRTSSSNASAELSNHRHCQEISYVDVFRTSPSIGPFLDAVLRKLESMLSNGLVVNLQLTGLISRLAIHPQPLLRSFLLNSSLVFQPSIRSLFQVLGGLKHRIDQLLARQPNLEELVAEAQEFLVGREDRLTNARRLALEAAAPSNDHDSHPQHNQHHRNSLTNDPFSRGDVKRRSLSSTISSVFRRATQSTQPIKEQLESAGEAGVYRYFHKPVTGTGQGNVRLEEDVRNIVLCAVILDEWLKELAAIAQEHSVLPSRTELYNNNLW